MPARLELLKAEEEKMLYLIPKLDPTTEEYGRVLNNYERIHYLVGKEEKEGCLPPMMTFIAKPEQNEEPAPTAETTQAEPEPALTPTITKDECAEILGRLRLEKRVNVAKLIKSLGYEKLSAVPAEKYQELIDAAKAEAGET